MSASIEIPFAIGTILWWTGNGYHSKTITCPECCGTKLVKLTLGNGEQYEIDCGGCWVGCDPPRGFIEINYTKYEPRHFECVSVEAAGADGFRYRDHFGNSVKVADLFTDENACAAECVRMNERHEIYSLDGQIRNRSESARKKCAWSVHYWRRQRADLVKQIARIDERLRAIAALRAPAPARKEME